MVIVAVVSFALGAVCMFMYAGWAIFELSKTKDLIRGQWVERDAKPKP